MKYFRHIAWFFIAILFFAACSNQAKSSVHLTLNKKNFADTINGKVTSLYVLKNKEGMRVAVTNYGGRIVSIVVPNKDHVPTDVVVGFQNIKEYINSPSRFYGAIIGRVANRIAKGTFTLNGKQYHLAINNPPNSLHGGNPGYQDVVWNANQLNDSTLQLSYLSKDGEAGYPGNLLIWVNYTVGPNDVLKISYEAETDKTTVVSLTNHSYFNLNGLGSGTISNELLQINADRFTPVDSTLIPTGKLVSVEGTPYDFRQLTPIGKRINKKNVQLHYGKGYDMNFVLNNPNPDSLFHAATVIGNKSGIVMKLYTVEPGLQFYSGNYMAGKDIIKTGVRDNYRTAFAMEPQHFPDSPNHKNFPSIVLQPGQVYRTYSVYQFSIKKN